MNRPWVIPAMIAVFAALLACCLCAVLVSSLLVIQPFSSGYTDRPYIIATQDFVFPDFPGDTPFAPATTIPPLATATTIPSLASATSQPVQTPAATLTQPAPQETPIPVSVAAFETLNTLLQAEAPINDKADLAQRLEGKTGIPLTLEPPASPFQVGDRKIFTITDTDTNENFDVQATLRYITEHSYFWIEDGVSYNRNELSDLAETFENRIYPTNRAFFGDEWSPGVDGDPHLYILYAGGLGGQVAGYFSTEDSYNPLLVDHSNGHEMFVLSTDHLSLGREYTYGILAHEFQHMIHWYRDRNESLWLNEGFSDLAMFLNGYDIGGHDLVFTADPDLQLNDWPNDPGATIPHYGAAFLFTAYFLDRFGEETTRLLVANPENGMDSIDTVLGELNARDPQSGALIGADDVFADWTLANYLKDASLGDGRFTYHNYPNAPQTFDTETVAACSAEWQTRDVHQYGADYIRIRCQPGEASALRFQGATTVGVLPVDPYSGAYAFWSSKGEESDMTLTRAFDFTQVSGPLTLSYQTWYDIEKDFDYVYLLASLDGESWQMLDTPSGTDKDLTGNNYGWGYNNLSGSGSGSSPAWINESVDISQFAGQNVQLRFEYITDGAVNGEGFLLDDIAIPEIGYFSDFEQDDGGWQAAGFVRIANSLPQTLRLSLVRWGAQTTLEYIPLTADNTAEIPLHFEDGMADMTLVVSGATRFTRQKAIYRFSFVP